MIPSGFPALAFSQDPTGTRSRGDQKRWLFSLPGRWQWIAFGLGLGILFGLYQVSRSQKIYRATATLLVNSRMAGWIDRSDPLCDCGPGSVVAMNTVAGRLRRMELLERVAARPDIRHLDGPVPEEPGLVPDWAAAWIGGKPAGGAVERGTPEPAAMAVMISNRMQVSVRKGTRLIDVSIEHPVPEVAKALADAVAREFIAEMAADDIAARSAAISLLEGELDGARAGIGGLALGLGLAFLLVMLDRKVHGAGQLK